MTRRILHRWLSAQSTGVLTLLLVGLGVVAAEAQQSPPEMLATGNRFATSWRRLGHVDHALALAEAQTTPSARPPTGRRSDVNQRGRWPLRADPRRWPRLFANTSECTLSFDPVLRRHWWN